MGEFKSGLYYMGKKRPDLELVPVYIDNVNRILPRGEFLPGPEAYKRDYHRWRDAFPDGEVKITRVIVEGDWAVVEFINRGTQTGPLQSALGTFPPSGRFMEVRYCSVMRVAGGLVVEGRDYYDSASIARQLGHDV